VTARGTRLYAYAGGLLRPGRVRRILTLAGLPPRLGLPGPGDLVGVWGRGPRAGRGEAIAARRGADLLRIEDAFLRSVRPGRAGDPPLGLLLDRRGVHFDGGAASDLEHLLATHPLDDPALLQRARDGIARLRPGHLSKYNLCDPAAPSPPPGYVLVVDQVAGDAALGGAGAAQLSSLLQSARDDHPGARIVVRTHPEAALGLRRGALAGDATVTRAGIEVSPWALLEGAVAVYTVSSQLGFEAILAGHRPVVAGRPFYAGWGLSEDALPLPRRGRRLTPAQLFAAAMILAPVWYDPCRDRLCPFEEAVDQLEAEVRAFREDRGGHVAIGMRRWKRPRLQAFFGAERRLRFTDDPARAARIARDEGRQVMVWAGTAPDTFPLPLARVEDGFLRSRGLGAALVPPLSLVRDELGIHFDPGRESALDRAIAALPPPGGLDRAARLIAALRAGGLSKYNTGGALPPLPAGHRILVPGQVEDDASIRLGCGAIRSNLGLLQAVRAANPNAVILYKPHPDVAAGLRPGAIAPDRLAGLADAVLSGTDPAAALAAADELWTMTSLMGFEALIRGLPVTCLGAPFYAGWGLTRDLGPPVPHRRARPGLAALAHAALFAYPRYFDPVSRRPCPPEVVVERLVRGPLPSPGPANRALAAAQGLFAGRAALWR
jgi:capsular polysaccharide export protein